MDNMQLQLRMYTINRGALDDFVREWGVKIKPLRLKLGFTIFGAWTIRESNQFVWLMGYDGLKQWEEVDREYHLSPERRLMDPDPARHIARIEHFFVDPVDEN